MDDHGERLARIETKVDMLLKRDESTEERLRTVERKQWYHSGALALAALVATKFGLPH